MNVCIEKISNEVHRNENIEYVTDNKKNYDVIDGKSLVDISDATLRANNKIVCKPMTVNELYAEILFLILNNFNETSPDDEAALVKYLQEAFDVSEAKHFQLLRNLQMKNPPQKILSIEVNRAENLLSMDSNGLSDAFVTLYVESNSTNRYNTAVAPATLCPSWREHFLIPIQRNPATEVLVVEVWDFDAAESVGEKMNKILEAKGIRGLKKLFKEIALTASTGKHDNELIGKIEIPLKLIPATGLQSWYTLKKNSNNKNRGSILLHLYFSTEKNKILAIDEHLSLLRIFLLYELRSKTDSFYSWCGTFSTKAQIIIKRHCVQSNLSEIDCILCQWEVYTEVHETHYLSMKLFKLLLEKLMPGGIPDCTHVIYANQLWVGYKRILPSCFAIVRSIRSEKFEETFGNENLSAALEIIKKAELPAIPDNIDLFPLHVYGWLGKSKEGTKFAAETILKETIKLSALQFLNKLYENNSKTCEIALDELIIVMRSIISDLKTAIEFHDKIFSMKSNIKYAVMLYGLYQEQVEAIFFPKIVDACNNLRQLNILDEELTMISNTNEFKSGMLLFDLYLGFKRFANLGSGLFLTADNLVHNTFYEHFYPAVANWLNISVIKTLTRIEKAVELDEFHSHNNMMKFTTSALDTLSLFYQIKYFWEQLDWPNIEESYLFVEKVVNDICRCCVFYAKRLSLHIKKLKEMDYTENGSQGLKEFCYAINNIGYIKESLPLFVKELKIDDILNKLAELRSIMEAERCSITINNILCNTTDIVENEIFELIEVMARTFVPVIQKMLEEACAADCKNADSTDITLKYFQSNLEVLQIDLKEESMNILRSMICNELSLLMQDFMRRESNNYREPSFFGNVHAILNIIFQILNFETIDPTRATLSREMFANLNLYTMETKDLIHRYYEDRHKVQNMKAQNKYGQLTIKANFLKDSLHVHILNAYNLLPMNSENSCNSYVKVHFTPPEDFAGIKSLRTSVQQKTRYPLYDEQFFIKLTTQQCHHKTNILVFCVKNKDLFGLCNYYVAECYLSFSDIEAANDRQFRISLDKPTYPDNGIEQILSARTGDRLAREFLKKLRQKSSRNNKIFY